MAFYQHLENKLKSSPVLCLQLTDHHSSYIVWHLKEVRIDNIIFKSQHKLDYDEQYSHELCIDHILRVDHFNTCCHTRLAHNTFYRKSSYIIDTYDGNSTSTVLAAQGTIHANTSKEITNVTNDTQLNDINGSHTKESERDGITYNDV